MNNFTPLKTITGPWTRVDSAIDAYTTGDYDFGIDASVIMTLTGYDADKAKNLVQNHTKNDIGM